MGDVVGLPTTLDLPAGRILDNAPRDMTDCMVIGYDADGELYIASSTGDLAQIVLLLEVAKQNALGRFV